MLTTSSLLRAVPVFALASVLVGCDAENPEVFANDADPLERGAFVGQQLYVEADGNAERQADLWRRTDPVGAAAMDRVASQPISIWLGDWLPDVTRTVDDAIVRANGDLQVFTVYNIPNRDCGSYSAGGVADRDAYADFIDGVADGLAGAQAIVILEPDALALDDCLSEAGRQERYDMMSDAVDTLTAAGASVYLDAGDSNWIPADDMADRLQAAGVARAAGFALNVSHTEYTRDENAYAADLRSRLGRRAHYVVDTSRNGLGPAVDNEWCNPAGRAHGAEPTLRTRAAGLDAMLWIKRPGESDGTCHGGPRAGAWWPEYALDLALLAGY